ncbi:hypothetical protein [Ornithinimicrobium sp. INDO-MA30-4]|uniref:hypothetical protein n=1 Tax=Ornithinimicrobium sp. INDO-MA30-4 TaxID=2908651 RepID=UPI001F37FFD6|nr:hypothetical protein [Ornithinimicrobium sp. INDO-MA30-4]UJH71766.1 hypothetical protein L0A91_16920 [Ornithinimicrobium sp. INDO-MA30-4]
MDRWEELFEASENLEQPDGQRLSDPNVLQPGWVIALPTAAPSSATPQTPENPENVVDQVAQSDATQAAEETTAAAGTLAGAVPIAGNAAALGLSPTAQQAGALVQAEPADLEAGAQADVSEQDQSGWSWQA